MLSLANVGVIVLSFMGTMFCHCISPYIHKRIWRNYGILYGVEKCKFDRHFANGIAGILCSIFALQAFIFDPDFHQLGLVGSSTAGNAILDITIGQYLAELLYQWMVEGTYESFCHVFHHFVGIVGAAVTHNFFHRLAVYRCIHLIILPFRTITDQMRKLNYNTSNGLFKCLMLVYLFVFFFFRVTVIPFHWYWYFRVIETSKREWSEIWPSAWIVFIGCSVVIDCLSILWGGLLVQRCLEIRKN